MEDISMLQWLYSGREEPVHQSFQQKAFFQLGQKELFALAKRLVPIYTPAINCPSLRYSLLVFVGVITSGGRFTQREEANSGRARRALLDRLTRTSDFDEGDAFAVFLLAFTTWVDPTAKQNELVTHLNGFVAAMDYISNKKSRGSLWYFRTIARDLLLHAAARELTNNGCLRFYLQCRAVLGPPSFEQRSEYLGNDSLDCFFFNISYHEMILTKALPTLLWNDDSFRSHGWISEIKVDIENMYAGLHGGVLPYVDVNTSTDTVAIELSFITLMTHYICVVYIAIFEASDFVEGLSNIGVRQTVLELLKLVSGVVEYNRRLRGTWDFILQDTAWLCARSLLLVAITFPESHSELKVCDGFVTLSKRVLIYARYPGYGCHP
jgi:hypothetical protein